MKEVIIRIVPPCVEEDEFEDLLATDNLFVEYFNAFLQLPTFPEPLVFNKETAGFEVHTDAKRQLANEIKAAIRAGKPRKRIYRAVHNHSFRPIPLIPIDQTGEETEREINTSFIVKTLNKEQGIQWVKRERLPLFLESDFYLEYRLARLVAQAQVARDNVAVRVDYSVPRVKTVQEEEAEVEVVDEKEVLMREAYVCMGNASSTDTEAWVTQAKITMDTNTVPSSNSVRTSQRAGSAMSMYPYSLSSMGRPMSARSNPSLLSRGGTKLDSGVYSSTKSSMLYPGSVDYQSLLSGATGEDLDDIPLGGDLFDHGPKPPRPSDSVCAVSQSKAGRVYANPRPPTPPSTEPKQGDEASSSTSTEDLGIEEDHVSVSTEGGVEPTVPSQPVIVDSIDQLCAVLVSTVLKSALCEITGKSESTVLKEAAEIRQIVESQPAHLQHLSFRDLDNVEFDIKKGGADAQNKEKSAQEQAKEEGEDEIGSSTILGGNGSDEDSLLNSDDDYEEELDDFFRKGKPKNVLPTGCRLQEEEQNLTSLKSLLAFKKFLHATPGERNWLLWMDIERAKLIHNPNELHKFLLTLRERYHKHGAVYELSTETKQQLALSEPTSWTLNNLCKAQNQITEPLVLYWAPQFLVKQKVKAKPEQNPLYLQQKVLQSKPESHPQPHPPVPSALPLRPKTCMPRLRQSAAGGSCVQSTVATNSGGAMQQQTQAHSLQVEDACQELNASRESSSLSLSSQASTSLRTAPPLGFKRNYALPESFTKGRHRIQVSPQDLYVPRGKESLVNAFKSSGTESKVKLKVKTPRDLIRATLKVQKARPSSAPVRLGSVTSSKSAPATPVKRAAWDLGSEVSDPMTSQRQGAGISISRRSSDATTDSEISVFAGGRRMEALLQALANERKSGGIMRKHLERVKNQLWTNCFGFWLGLQAYHELYYSEVIDPYLLEIKAKSLHSMYVVAGAPYSVQCSNAIQEYIYYHMDPPYEELFDDAEEYVLPVLFDAWTALLSGDLTTFDKIELIESKRKLDARSKYLVTLQRRGIIKDRPDTPEVMEGYEDPVYDEALLEKVPAEYRDWTLDKLVHHRLELEHFKQYLAENYASMDLMCWMDIEAFRRIPHSDEKRRDVKAKDIKVKYFTKKYFFGPNSPAGKEGQEKVMQAGGGWGKLLDDRPPIPSLLEAQKYVRERLEKNWLPRFLATAEFAERQHPKVGMDDAVEDVLIQRKKKTQAIWRMIESKWVSSSKDIMTFRKALMNPVTSAQFRKFVSIKGENFENDVLFYQEVQRYKDLCHIHSDRSLVQQKTLAIINCFIDSPIPPALQLDIPQEMADKIAERKLEATPYLFRESQLTVFRVLFSHWSDFCTFRAGITDEKLTPTLERHRRKARLEEKRKARELEAKKSKDEARRRAMGLPVDADLEDATFDPFPGGGGAGGGSEDEEEGEGAAEKFSDFILFFLPDEARRRAMGLPVDADPEDATFDPFPGGGYGGESEDEGGGRKGGNTADEARRRAMGLPVDADLEDAMFDPFPGGGVAGGGSEEEGEGATERHDKAAVSWSYSQYVHGFDKEGVLNDVDASTFSSLTDRTEPLSDSMLNLLRPAGSQDGHTDTGDKTAALGAKAPIKKPKADVANGTNGRNKGRASPKERRGTNSGRATPNKSISDSPTSPLSPKQSVASGPLVVALDGKALPSGNGALSRGNTGKNGGGGGGPLITRKIIKS